MEFLSNTLLLLLGGLGHGELCPVETQILRGPGKAKGRISEKWAKSVKGTGVLPRAPGNK
jgi:hypothetical protein